MAKIRPMDDFIANVKEGDLVLILTDQPALVRKPVVGCFVNYSPSDENRVAVFCNSTGEFRVNIRSRSIYNNGLYAKVKASGYEILRRFQN